ncbi:MAG: hypothetical protein SF069_00705 [Phycisphaerae bacterium]|nr:hypothetical protein [Phycisphaerae bacterium]
MRYFLGGVLALAILGVMGVGGLELLRRTMLADVHRMVRELSETPSAQAAGRDLAVLCQTSLVHPEWFADEPSSAPCWAPPSVLRLQPRWVTIREDGVQVEYGGGFYHFGYLLRAAPSPKNDNGQTDWILHIYREDAASRELARVTLTERDVLTEAEFIDRTMTALEWRIARGDHWRDSSIPEYCASVQRCRFAIRHNQISRLQRSIRETARENPDAWRDVLLAYLIDARDDPSGAEERLRRWAASRGGYGGWLMAAYAFEKAGRLSLAEESVREACKFRVSDPPWMSANARAAGFRMCRSLYNAGSFEVCAMLCEAILAYQANGGYMAEPYQELRDLCRVAQSQPAITSRPLLHIRVPVELDPFEGIDVDAVTGAAHLGR